MSDIFSRRYVEKLLKTKGIRKTLKGLYEVINDSKPKHRNTSCPLSKGTIHRFVAMKLNSAS